MLDDLTLWQAIAHQLDPDAALLRAWRPAGGVSAQVTALQLQGGDGASRLVIVRQHGARDREANPAIASHEYQLLTHLAAAGLPTPTPLLLDTTCTLLPTPYLVIEYLAGSPASTPIDPADTVQQMAAALVAIHKVDSTALAFLPQRTVKIPPTDPAPAEDIVMRGFRAALQGLAVDAQHNPSVLVHGDFWTGNILWHEGRLVGVIDWEDACRADPLLDLANTRLEILYAYGAEAMHGFTEAYTAQRTVQTDQLVQWDIWAAIRKYPQIGRWGLAAETMARAEEQTWQFVQAALERL